MTDITVDQGNTSYTYGEQHVHLLLLLLLYIHPNYNALLKAVV